MSDERIVRDHMTAPATTVAAESTLLDAALLLRSSGFRHLPVTDGDRLVGIITDRDIQRLSPSLLSKISPEEYNSIFENTPLARVMTREPLTTTPDAPLRSVARILYEKKLGCLPVVEDGRLVGIITLTDLLGVLVDLLESSSAPRPVAK